MNVKWLRTVPTLALALFWPLAVMHCKLECVPGLEFLRCASDTPTSSDCQGDGCETVESGAYKTPDNQNVAPEPIFEGLIFSTHVEREDHSSHNYLHWLVTAAPPE